MKAKYKLNAGFITQKIGNKTTVFSGEQSMLFTLNETGAFIFQGLKLGWDKKKIISKLTEDFQVGVEEAARDIDAFTEELINKKILITVK